MMICWIRADMSNRSISCGMFLSMMVPLPEQTVADVREDVEEHVDDDEHERAHREDDQADLGDVRNGMERLVRDGRNELVRGARMALGVPAGRLLVGCVHRGLRVLGAQDAVGAVAAGARRRAGMAELELPAVEA